MLIRRRALIRTGKFKESLQGCYDGMDVQASQGPNTLPSINPLIALTATYFLLTLPGQVGRTTPSAVGGQGQTTVSQSTDLLGQEDARGTARIVPPSGGEPM